MGKRGPKPKKQAEDVGTGASGTPEAEGATFPSAGDTTTTITLPEAAEGKTMKAAPPEIAPCDTWRFHNEQPPRIFKAGEPIPAGWHKDRAKLNCVWHCDPFCNWTRTAKE